MVSIKYRTNCEIADYSRHTVQEAREYFRDTLGIPKKAKAVLNGNAIALKIEPGIVLDDDDELVFTGANYRGIIFIAAVFTAIAITGGIFTFGYINGTQSIAVTLSGSGGNFVDVTSNTTQPLNWNLPGNSSGDTGNGTLWDVDSAGSGYTGDLTAVVYLTNIEKMKHVYRGFGLFLAVYDSSGQLMDINNDGNASLNDDLAFLSLNNGLVELYFDGNADIFTMVVNHGFFLTNPYDAITWTSDAASPALYIEILQR